MSSPSRLTVPERMCTRPRTDLSRVDLPAPFGPMIPTNSPLASVTLQPLRMLTSGTYPAMISVASMTLSAIAVPEVHVVVGAQVGIDHLVVLGQ